MTFPIIEVPGPPSTSALMKSPAAGTNVRIAAATIPGSESGKTTVRNACQRLAYRSFAASTCRLSIRSSEAYSGSAAKGRKL
jgi:hypothetical protein